MPRPRPGAWRGTWSPIHVCGLTESLGGGAARRGPGLGNAHFFTYIAWAHHGEAKAGQELNKHADKVILFQEIIR